MVFEIVSSSPNIKAYRAPDLPASLNCFPKATDFKEYAVENPAFLILETSEIPCFFVHLRKSRKCLEPKYTRVKVLGIQAVGQGHISNSESASWHINII